MGIDKSLINTDNIKFDELIKLASLDATCELIQDQETKQHLSPERNGRFTGSELKLLFTCERSHSFKDWVDKDGNVNATKIKSFGKTSIKYMFEKMMERRTGISYEKPDLFQFQYGRKAEVLAKSILKEKYNVLIDEVGFKFFPGLEKIAGCTPDGLVKKDDWDIMNLEIKSCPAGWGEFYGRVFEPFDSSHKDFWQIQMEMMCTGTKKTMYVVCPPTPFNPSFDDVHIIILNADENMQAVLRDRLEAADNLIQNNLEISDLSFINKIGEVK